MNKDGPIHIQNIGGGTFVSKSDFDRFKELTKTIVNTPKEKKRKPKKKTKKPPKKKGREGRVCPSCNGRGHPVTVYLSVICRTCGGNGYI
jgi:DnaJ-class molecular chaperone